MSNDVLERLSRANPVPHDPPAPPLGPLLDRLAEPPSVRSGRRLRELAMFGLAIAAVIVVAAVFLGTAGRRPISAGSAPSADRELIAELGVLRRPQTAADRALPAALSRLAIPRLTRLAIRVGEIRVFVIVQKRLPRTAFAIAVTPEGRFFPLDLGTAASLRHPRPVALNRTAPLHGSLVPNGVAVVVWTFQPASGRGPVTAVGAQVRGNVTVARFGQPRGALSRVTWWGPHGQVIASLNLAAARARQVRAEGRASSRSDKRPIAHSLLAHFTLFRLPRSHTPGPKMPVGIAAGYANQAGLGLNVGRARFIALSGTERPVSGYPHGVWAIPGSHGLCLLDTQLAGICGGLTGRGSPDSGGFRTLNGGGSSGWVDGIVPNGNPTVTIVLSNGKRVTVPVVHNLYAAALKAHAVALIDKNAAGQTVTFPL
jgi:hypothetical protein